MSSTRLVRRSAERVPEDPVTFWLTRLDLDTQKANRSQFNRWMQWLHKQKGWETVTPRELLVRHLERSSSQVCRNRQTNSDQSLNDISITVLTHFFYPG